MAAPSTKFRCFVCHLVCVSVSQLHYHQMFGHSLEELSISVISLQGLLNLRDLTSGRTICDEMLLESLIKYPQLVICPVKPSNPANCSIDSLDGEDFFPKDQEYCVQDIKAQVKQDEEIYFKNRELAENEWSSTLCADIESSSVGLLGENQTCSRRLGDQSSIKWREELEGYTEISHESFLESVRSFSTELSRIKRTMVDETVPRQDKVIDTSSSARESDFNGIEEISHESFLESVRGICNDLSRMKDTTWRGKWPGKKNNVPMKGGQRRLCPQKVEAKLSKEMALKRKDMINKKWIRNKTKKDRRYEIESRSDAFASKRETIKAVEGNERLLEQNICTDIPIKKEEPEFYPDNKQNLIKDRISSGLSKQSDQNGAKVEQELESQEFEFYPENVGNWNESRTSSDLSKQFDQDIIKLEQELENQEAIIRDDVLYPEFFLQDKLEKEQSEIFVVNEVEHYNDACTQLVDSREEAGKVEGINERLLDQGTPMKEGEFYPENKENLIDVRTSSGFSKQSDQDDVNVEQEMESQEVPSQEVILQDDVLYPKFFLQDKIGREGGESFLVNKGEHYNDVCTQLVDLRVETIKAEGINESLLDQGIPMKEGEFYPENKENLIEVRTSSGLPKQSDQDNVNVEQEMESQNIPLQEAILQNDVLYPEFFPRDRIEGERSDSFVVNEVEHYNEACTQLVDLREEIVKAEGINESSLEQRVCTGIPMKEEELEFYPENKKNLIEDLTSSGLSIQSDQDIIKPEQEIVSQEIPLQEAILQNNVLYMSFFYRT